LAKLHCGWKPTHPTSQIWKKNTLIISFVIFLSPCEQAFWFHGKLYSKLKPLILNFYINITPCYNNPSPHAWPLLYTNLTINIQVPCILTRFWFLSGFCCWKFKQIANIEFPRKKKKSMLSPQCVHTWANGIAQATLVVIEWQISSIIVEINFFYKNK